MREKLPDGVFKKLKRTIQLGENLDTSIAETVAHAIKEWALEQEVTHFAHWFHPLSRGTAEKHDSFLSIHGDEGVFERFSAAQLVQAEPDASSFPSGGIRTTFEARGYTAWDSSSPVFIIKGENGGTLFIPSVFVSYSGEALDTKTPLLRSMSVLDKEVRNLLGLIGIESQRVISNLGPEQEFFLVDREYYLQRPDLILTGRTLIGGESPRGQKLEDHYFGTIPSRVITFMRDLEKTAYSLGIPLMTRHNEVAPRQYEIAPIFEDSNIGTDHNHLLMEIMPDIARKHGLEVLFHEKPFKGINGSGKHNNWSIQTIEGTNLFDPGANYDEQLRFMLFISVVLNAIKKHGYLLRAAIAVPGNDFRLGANEAPPAIISTFLGSTITNILDRIETGEYNNWEALDKSMEINLHELPDLLIGNTYRNRTSPFAFTGNKFEFRAVGSSQSLSIPNLVLNTIIASSVKDITKLLKKKMKNQDRQIAILEVIKEVYIKSKDVVFNGDNYSDDWVTEAAKRGLPNLRTSFDALQQLVTKDTLKLFAKMEVFSEKELIARYNVDIHHLGTLIQIEGNTLLNMIDSEIVPAILEYFRIIGVSESNGVNSFDSIKNRHIEVFEEMHSELTEFRTLLEEIRSEEDEVKIAERGVNELRPMIEGIRPALAYFESNIPSDLWPYPTYTDILHKY